MKHILFSILLLLIAQSGFSQMGIAGAIIGQQKQAEMRGHKMFHLQVTIPVSISNKITGAKVIMPPVHFSGEIGIGRNLTLGGMIGYMSTQSPTYYSTLNGISQSIDGLSSIFGTGSLGGLLGSIFTDPITGQSNSITGTYNYKLNYTLIGLLFKYHFVGGPHTNLYIGTRTGYKLQSKTVQKQSGYTNETNIADEVGTALNAASNIFYTGLFGANVFLDKRNRFAISADGGMGYGLGDGIALGNSTFFISVGGTYHISPKKKGF